MKRITLAVALVLLIIGCTERKYVYLPTPPCPVDTVYSPADVCDSTIVCDKPRCFKHHHCSPECKPHHEHHHGDNGDCKGP